jgi:hypothetical protein
MSLIKVFTLLLAASISSLSFAYERSMPPLPLKKYLNNMYLDHTLGLRAGTPTSGQNIEISTKEIYLQKELAQFSIGLMTPSIEIAVAQLNGGADHGYNYSLGPAYAIPMTGFASRLRLTAHTKVHWLTRHEFRSEDGINTKNYGGPVHWSYAVGGKYQIEKNAYMEYTWQHMSNGDVYDYNPALETHNLTIGVNF